MDDPHIKWLQMACAIQGKNITLIFFKAVVSLGCAAHLSMKSKIFSVFFGPLSVNPIARETNQKWLKLSMNWNLLCIWWGDFLHF